MKNTANNTNCRECCANCRTDHTQPTRTITVALAGNPNSGKTTIFNNLTGSNQHVGNYPGVTVETREGTTKYKNFKIKLVDLPGSYSLSAYSIEEIVAQDFLLNKRPDVIVNVVDGSNLQRNLYLTTQLTELGSPLVVALNMADEIKKKGIAVDIETLGKNINAYVVPTIGTRNKGTGRLLERIVETAMQNRQTPPPHKIDYGEDIEQELEKLAGMLPKPTDCQAPPRWLALKLLENDSSVTDVLPREIEKKQGQKILEQAAHSRKRIERILGQEPQTMIAERRYGFVHGLVQTVVKPGAEARIELSDEIDTILTNRLAGLPIFAALMYATFWLVFTLGAHPVGWIENAIEFMLIRAESLWPAGTLIILRSMVFDGIVAGVGTIVTFLPNIMLLFLALALLEDTGYMARAAFIMDRLMKWVGLHGKSFVPMLTGFGCSVPAIMGTRILENRRDRLTTMLVLPLMSCSARVPIYMLIIPAFFPPARAATLMYAVYVIGIVLAVLCAKLLRSTVFRGQPSPFVMELPPYRIPTLKAVTMHMWHRSWMYLRKAGTIILAISIVLWAMSHFPRPGESSLAELGPQEAAQMKLDYSVAGRIGHAIEPIIKPMGFDWKIGTALLGSFAAKELFVSQMGIVYSLGDADNAPDALRRRLRKNYTPLTGFCVMLFCLISTPCMATVAVTRRESGGWRWAMLQFWGLTLLGYIVTVLVYQVGSALGIGLS